MNKLKTPILIACLMASLAGIAQTAVKPQHMMMPRGLTDFPGLKFTDIPGAPKLTTPVLITGNEKPVLSRGHGLAAPAFFDWDGDGLKDLLIGEFGSGTENGRYVGNFIRVYKNTGTEQAPVFSGSFDYARAPFKLPGNGTPYSVDQFCCIGFTPQFVDLDNDGLQDMITGNYYGEVYWFGGNKEGFKQGAPLEQQPPKEGDPRNGQIMKKPHQFYWLYSAASFGDFTGDGLPDLITGGRALRLSKNIGTATAPKFSQRELLLDVNGNPLKVYTYHTAEEMKFFEDRKILGYAPAESGDNDLSPYVVDWDTDGTMDILVTNSYTHKGLATVDFFKGVKTKEGIRFKPAVPLFTVNEGKAFPGMGPRVTVTDWNNDGINDLLIGISVVTVNEQFNDRLSWQWEEDNHIAPAGKDPVNLTDLPAETLKRFKESVKVPAGITLDEIMTLRHQGYIYLLLGKK